MEKQYEINRIIDSIREDEMQLEKLVSHLKRQRTNDASDHFDVPSPPQEAERSFLRSFANAGSVFFSNRNRL